MFYPMRSIRTKDYHLIHNLNFKMPFPIDQDFFLSPTFQDILNRTKQGLPLPWFKTLEKYYYRSEWELYDLLNDPHEVNNVANNPRYYNDLVNLKRELKSWMNITADPWICAPGAVFEFQGKYKNSPQCLSMENGLDKNSYLYHRAELSREEEKIIVRALFLKPDSSQIIFYFLGVEFVRFLACLTFALFYINLHMRWKHYMSHKKYPMKSCTENSLEEKCWSEEL